MLCKVPKSIKLILNETNLITLLEISSSTEDPSESIISTNAVNLHKERYRHIIKKDASVQTLSVMTTTKYTQSRFYAHADTCSTASNWEMYDTFVSTENNISENIQGGLENECNSTVYKRFFEVALVLERLLSNNIWSKQQKEFKNKSYEEDYSYNYKPQFLWTFSTLTTKSKCVTALALHKKNEDIIAAGYGTYHFSGPKNIGFVMIWNIKNPKNPERSYHFVHAVTTLQFSTKYPAYLIVGFYNGTLKILDISQKQLRVVYVHHQASFDPLWDLIIFEDAVKEFFLACFGDGRICKYQFNKNEVACIEITRVVRKVVRNCIIESIADVEFCWVPCSKFVSVNCLSIHVSEPLVYLASTSEGLIYKWKIDCPPKQDIALKAHVGTIRTIKFSKLIKNVYATCGDDFQISLWIDDFHQPLIRLKHGMENVTDLDWSPSHSTILVSLNGSNILVWDLQKQHHYPQSQTNSPTKSINTVCKFFQSGRCLLVGDINGNVHVFSLRGLPFPHFFPDTVFQKFINNLRTSKI